MQDAEAEAVTPRLWEQLAALAEAGEREALAELVDGLGEADRVHAFAHLEAEGRAAVLALLGPERAAEVVEAIPDVQAAEAVHELAPVAAAEILEALESDERADLLAQLDDADTEAILAAATPETAASARALLQYPADCAGGLMVDELVAVPEADTVDRVVEHLRANVERYADYVIQYVYALGPGGELRGVVPLRDLLLARGDRTLASLMIRDPVRVPAKAPLQELFETFDAYDFLGLPVVDETGRLVGVLLREDVDEARVDRAEADELKARGIVGGEELRTMPVWLRSGRRLSWLSINIVLNVIAASVIALYQDTLEAVIALAVFLQINSDMSGCSGNQAVAVSLRELALGVTRPGEVARVWLKEISVGAINGLALGTLLASVAWFWQGNATLGLVVGAALALNTLVAVSIGGTVPLVIRRLGYDPALASGPVLTTVTDMCGFFLVLSLATVALSRLT